MVTILVMYYQLLIHHFFHIAILYKSRPTKFCFSVGHMRT